MICKLIGTALLGGFLLLLWKWTTEPIRDDGWAIYKTLRRTEGSREKWGHS